jgi:hypothetical protein
MGLNYGQLLGPDVLIANDQLAITPVHNSASSTVSTAIYIKQ